MGMKKLTEKKKAKYLEQGGAKCPHCNSGNLQGDSLQSDGGYVWQDIECLDCDMQWVDVYSLTDIDDPEEQV